MAKPQAKASKQRRSAAQIQFDAMGAPDPFQWLVDRWCSTGERNPDKVRLALELIPYLKPKLKAVTVEQTANVEVTVTIGGTNANDQS